MRYYGIDNHCIRGRIDKVVKEVIFIGLIHGGEVAGPRCET